MNFIYLLCVCLGFWKCNLRSAEVFLMITSFTYYNLTVGAWNYFGYFDSWRHSSVGRKWRWTSQKRQLPQTPPTSRANRRQISQVSSCIEIAPLHMCTDERRWCACERTGRDFCLICFFFKVSQQCYTILFHRYMEKPRYYNLLSHEWATKYHKTHSKGKCETNRIND